MTEIDRHAPGMFCWADLATTDAEAAGRFYTELFGWTATDMPAGEGGKYTMLEKNGKSVCALYTMCDEMREQGVPPHWISYVSVDNVDESTQKATALGGTVIQPPFDVMNAGRMAVVQDPTGAALALWQPKQHIGAQCMNEPSSLCWNELCTKDLQAASKFYTALFDWNTNQMKGATGQDYIVFMSGERPAGGMLEIQEEWGEVPPNWAVYFAVEDCDGTLEKAQSLGGKAEMQPMEIKDIGRFAVVQDPQGGHFAIIQMKEGAS